MSEVAILADIHFGVPDRLDDILWGCRVAREYCHKAGIDTIFILGDLFHDRKYLEIGILTAVCEFFEECAEKYEQKWVVFPGNHDMFLRHSWSVNSLLPLKKHLTVIEKVKKVCLDDTRNIWILPFITYEHSYMSVMQNLNYQADEGDVLFTHIGVRGASLNTCFLLKDWSSVNFTESKFSRVYTGHFHSRQQVGSNVWYPGSIIPFKFDEGDIPHGFYVYNTISNEHKFVDIWKAGARFFPDSILPPQFYTLTEANVDDDIEYINGIVRVKLSREYSKNEKAIITEKLKQRNAKSVRFMNPTERIETVPDRVSNPNKNLFESWIEKDQPELDQKLLLKLHMDITVEGDELYTVSASEE